MAIIALALGTLFAVVVGVFASDGPPAPLGHTRISPEYGSAHATLRRIGSHAELAISGMPQAPIGEVYQIWLVRANAQPVPTDALFTVTEAGKGSVEVPGSLRGIREVMVTTEPVGGSVHPTSLAVLRVLLGRSSNR